jgi:hypothetical protein
MIKTRKTKDGLLLIAAEEQDGKIVQLVKLPNFLACCLRAYNVFDAHERWLVKEGWSKSGDIEGVLWCIRRLKDIYGIDLWK